MKGFFDYILVFRQKLAHRRNDFRPDAISIQAQGLLIGIVPIGGDVGELAPDFIEQIKARLTIESMEVEPVSQIMLSGLGVTDWNTHRLRTPWARCPIAKVVSSPIPPNWEYAGRAHRASIDKLFEMPAFRPGFLGLSRNMRFP